MKLHFIPLVGGALATLVVALALLASPVHAQQKKYYGLIISPPINEFNDPVAPGQSVAGSFTLTNDFASSQTISLDYRILDVAQKDNAPVFLDDQDEILRNQFAPLSMKGWIKVDKETITIPFGQSVTINYTIAVPPNASPGGRYASIFYSLAGGNETAGAGLGQNLGHLVFLNVKGTIIDRSEVVSFTSDRTWYDFLPLTFTVNVRNSGNTHTNIGGNIFVFKNDITKPIFTTVVNPTNGFILPLNERSFDHQWNDGWITWQTGADGKRSININWGKFTTIYWGKHHAQLKLRHTVDGERVTTTKEVSFWIIPWQVILPLALILLFIVWRVWPRKPPHPRQLAALAAP